MVLSQDLDIPPFLDALKIRGMTAKDLPAYRERLAARHASEPVTPKMPAPPAVSERENRLTARDREVIAELEAPKKDEKKKWKWSADRKAMREREGQWIPGSHWVTSRGRWVHPALEVKERAPTPETGEPIMAKKSKAKKETGGREISVAAGKVGGFAPVRAGSARAKVIELGAKGDHTVAQIANRIGKDRKTVLTHLFCLSRDSGIGYEVSKDTDKVKVSFPGSKTLKDAIKAKAA